MVEELTTYTPDAYRAGSEFNGSRFRPTGSETTQPRLKDMLGTVAHELRNPLATAITAVRVIGSARERDRVSQRTLTGLENQLQHAIRIVDDLFDLSAGGLGKLSLEKEVVALGDVVAKATETASGLVAARGHHLSVSLPRDPINLDADPVRLAQIISNLLCNAAKFTDPGGQISLSAGVDGSQVVIVVRDNGRGIAPQMLPRIFELYQQIPGRASGGLGIGLALVKSLVELHGGSVVARSDGPGNGSEFVVRLPIVTERDDLCAPFFEDIGHQTPAQNVRF